MGEEKFASIFAKEENRAELLKDLNGVEYFGEAGFDTAKFNSTFFSSDSPEATGEQVEFTNVQAEPRVQVSEAETSGLSTDLPDVQTELTVPTFDPNFDATQADLSNIQAPDKNAQYLSGLSESEAIDIESKIKTNQDDLFKDVSGIDGIKELEVDKESKTYKELRSSLVDKFEQEVRDGDIPPLYFGKKDKYVADQKANIEGRADKALEVFVQQNKPENVTFRDLQEESFQKELTTAGLGTKVAATRLNEAIEAYNNTPMTPQEAKMKEMEINALAEELKKEEVQFETNTGQVAVDEALEVDSEEAKDYVQKYFRGNLNTPSMATFNLFIKNQPKEEAIAQLSTEFSTDVDQILKGDNDAGVKGLVSKFQDNPYFEADGNHRDALKNIVAEINLGRYTKDEGAAALSDLYLDLMRKQIEPKTLVGKLAYGVATIPYSIVDDMAEIAPELLTINATVVNRDDERILESKQAIADAYNTGDAKAVAQARQNYFDTETNVINEFFESSGSINLGNFNMAEAAYSAAGGKEGLKKYQLDRATASKIKTQNRSLTDSTWDSIGKKYDDGEIGSFERRVGRLGVALSNAFQSSPSMMQAMIPYVGITSMATGAGADKYFEGIGDLDADKLKLLKGAAAVGLAEGLSGQVERYIGGKAWRSMTDAGKKSALKELVTNSRELMNKTNEQYRKALLRELGNDAGEFLFDSSAEGFSEMLVTMTSNIVDRDVLGKDVSPFDGMGETFLTGFAMGGTVGTITLGNNIKQTIENPFAMSDQFREVYNAARQVQSRAKKGKLGVNTSNDVQGLQAKIEAVVLMTGASVSDAADAVRATMPNVKGDASLDSDLNKATLDAKDNILSRTSEAESRVKLKMMLNNMSEGNVDQVLEQISDREDNQDNGEAINPDQEVAERRADTADTAAMSNITAENNQVTEMETSADQSYTVNGEDKVYVVGEQREGRTPTLNMSDGTETTEIAFVSGEFADTTVHQTEDGGYTINVNNQLSESDTDTLVPMIAKIIAHMKSNGVTDAGKVKLILNFDSGIMDDTIAQAEAKLKEVFGEGFTIGDIKPNATTTTKGITGRSIAQGREMTLTFDGAFNADAVGANADIQFKDEFEETAPVDPRPETARPEETLEDFGRRNLEATAKQDFTEEEAADSAEAYWEGQAKKPYGNWNTPFSVSRARERWEQRDRSKEGFIDGTMTDEQILERLEQFLQDQLFRMQNRAATLQGRGLDSDAEMIKIAMIELNKQKNEIKKQYLRTIRVAIDTQNASGGRFLFFTDRAAELDYINFWFGGASRTELGHYVGLRNYLVAFGSTLQKRIDFTMDGKNVEPLKMNTHFREVINHELFHSMLDKAFKALGADKSMRERLKVELVDQITEMFNNGELQFRSREDQNTFRRFLASYRNKYSDITSVIAEEMLVEIVPQIMTGKVYFNNTVKAGGLQKLLQTVLDIVNDLFNTDFDLKSLGFDELMTRTAEAEAFLTILSSVYTPEGQGMNTFAINGALVRLMSNTNVVSLEKMKRRGFEDFEEKAYNEMMASQLRQAEKGFGVFNVAYIDSSPEDRGEHINAFGEVSLRVDEDNLAAEVMDFNFGFAEEGSDSQEGTPRDFGSDALVAERAKYGGVLANKSKFIDAVVESDTKMADAMGKDVPENQREVIEEFVNSLDLDDPNQTDMMISQNTETIDIQIWASTLHLRYGDSKDRKEISKDTEKKLTKAILAAQQLAFNMDSIFLMPKDTDQMIRMNTAADSFNIAGGLGAFNYSTNSLMVDGRAATYSSDPEVAAKKMIETIYHEMFHAMLSISTKGKFKGSKELTAYLSNQIIDMLNSGALKFKDTKTSRAFADFIGRYPDSERAEEIVVETASLLFTGDLTFDNYKAGKGIQKLFNEFVKLLNQMFGTDIKIDFNQGTAAAEAFYTLAQMTMASAGNFQIEQEMFIAGITRLQEQAVKQAPKGLDAMTFLANNRVKIANFTNDWNAADPNAGTAFYNDAKSTGFIAVAVDADKAKQYGLAKGIPTFSGKKYTAIKATQDQALEMMADLGLSAVYTDKGILTLDGKVYPKGKGGDSIAIEFGKKSLQIEYSDTAKASEAKVEPRKYSPRVAKDAVESIKELKSDTDRARLNKIAAKLMSLGYVNAAKSILIAAEGSRTLKRYGVSTRIVFDKARKLRSDLAANTLDINLKDGNPVKVATDMAEAIFRNASVSYKNGVASALNSVTEGNTLSTILDILAGTSELTEEQQQQLTQQIISAKNKMLKALGTSIQIDEKVALIPAYREQVLNTAAIELMSYGDIEFESMIQKGVPVGSLNTDKYTVIKDNDYNRPRTISRGRLDQRAEDFELAYGLPAGSMNIPMFDHTTLPDDTPIVSVPHDRQFSGKINTPLGSFDFGGSGIAMFHPDRVSAGVVYMSDKQKVEKMVAQATRIADMMEKKDGVRPESVVVAAVMGQDNWQSNRDTAEFATQMAENFFGEAFTKKMPQSFKSAILSDEMIKTQDAETGKKVLSKTGKMLVELVANSNTIKDFFVAVENLSFDNRRKISSRYFLQSTLSNDTPVGAGAKAKKFFNKLGNALLGLSVDPMWNTIPDKHIFMMYEMDIAKTAQNIGKESPVEHRSYDTNVYGKPLGILNKTVFYPQAVSFPKEVLEATKPSADTDMQAIIDAYGESEAKVTQGTATKGDFENIVRMGREAGNTGVFNSGREIPAPADTESTSRLAASNVEIDPNTGVRFKVDDQAVAELKGQELATMNKVISQVKKYSEMLNEYGATIQVYADPESFKAAHIDLSDGALQNTYDSDPSYVAAASMRGSEIIVNLVHANTTTLPHEVIHLVSRGLLRNNAANRKVLSDFVKEVLGNPEKYIEEISIPDSIHLKTFANNYMNRGVAAMMEERFVEFTAFVAMGRVKFKSPKAELTFTQKLITALNKFLKKMGIKMQMPVKLADDRVAAQRFIEGLAMSISNGTEADQSTRDAAEEINTQGNTVQDTELQETPINRDAPADQVVDPNQDQKDMLSEEFTEGAKVEGVSSATTNLRTEPEESARQVGKKLVDTARRKRKAARLQQFVDDARTKAIDDITSGSIDAVETLTQDEITKLLDLLKGKDGYAIAAFIVAGDRSNKRGGMLFKGDAVMSQILADKLGINLTQAKALVEAVTARQFSSPESSTEAARNDDYTQVVINSVNFYMSTGRIGFGLTDKLFKLLGVAGHEGADTLIGDSNALLHRRVKTFAKAKRKALTQEIKKLESQLKMLIESGEGNVPAMESVSAKLDTAKDQLDNLQHIIDDVDAYNALDKSKSVATYQKAQMRAWFHEGGKKSFIARLEASGFTYADFNEIMLAKHTEERTIRNEQIIREAIGLTQVKALRLSKEQAKLQEKITKGEESGIDVTADKAKLKQVESQINDTQSRINELEEKLKKTKDHAEEVLLPQSREILARFNKRPESEREAYQTMFNEMTSEVITKRIEMLYDNGMITADQKNALLAGGRKSVDQLAREGKDRELREQLADGAITNETYLEKQRELDDSSIMFQAQREITEEIERLDAKFAEEKAARKDLDRQLANGTMDANTHQREVAKLMSEAEYYRQVNLLIDAKENLVFKFDNFGQYVPMQIDQDAYVTNVLEEAYAEYVNEESFGTSDYAEASNALDFMFDKFSNDNLQMGDDASDAFENLTKLVGNTVRASEDSAYRQMQKRLGDFRRQILGGLRRDSKKSNKTGTGTTIQSIRGNATFGLNEMVDPMTVLLAQFDLAAKISARNEAKNKLVKLIDEVNKMLSEEAFIAQNNGLFKFAKVVPTYRLRAAKVSHMVEAAVRDSELPQDVATSDQYKMNVYIDGQLHTIVFEEGGKGDRKGITSMARALLQDEATDFVSLNGGVLWKVYRGLLDYMRAAITTANVFFNTSNLMRDTTESLMNISYIYDTYQESGKSKKQITAEVAKDMAEMLKMQTAMFASYLKVDKLGLDASKVVMFEFPDPNGNGTYKASIHELIEMARHAGAQMSWSMINTDLIGDGMKSIKEAVAAEIKDQKDRSTLNGRMVRLGKRMLFMPYNLVNIANPEKHTAAYYLTQMADALENHNRMAAFMLALKRGLTVDQAAAAARNVTVNFEKTGTMLKSAKLPNESSAESTARGVLQAFQALYLFIRPAVQGGRKFTQRLNTPKGRTSLAFSALMNVASNIFTVMFNYDEDETALKNIYRNKYAVENYFYVPFGKNVGVNIPKPYSPDKALSTFVTQSFGAKYTGDAPADMVGDLIMNSVKLMLPLDITRAGSGMFDPTLAQPFMDLRRNKTYSGGIVLRNEDDPINSVSTSMMLGTQFFGHKISDKNIFLEASKLANRLSPPTEQGNEWSKIISPQGLEYLTKSYLTGKGVLNPVTQTVKALSSDEAQKLRQDKELSEGRIRLIQIGKASKYFKVDAGKVEMANNFFNSTKKNVKNSVFKHQFTALVSIEDSFTAAKEIGLLDTKSAKTMYKRRLVEWYTMNAGVNGISEGLFKEVAPEAHRFINTTDLTQKQVQRILDDEQIRSKKRLDKMKADGTWERLTKEEKRKFTREAYEEEKRVKKQVKTKERQDKKYLRNAPESLGQAWWESFFSED
jgi:hypothetical protein